jgi:hypothetical protein
MMKKTLLAVAIASALTGCSNLKFQWAASYQTDNLIEDLRSRKEAPPDKVFVDVDRDATK